MPNRNKPFILDEKYMTIIYDHGAYRRKEKRPGGRQARREEEIRKWKKKHPEAIKASMANPG